MEIIEELSRYIFLAGFFVLLIFQSLVIYAGRRAFHQVGLPIPKFWKHLMAFCLYLILFSILFVILFVILIKP